MTDKPSDLNTTPAPIPSFLKPVNRRPDLIVERVEGDRSFFWSAGDDTARMRGGWTANELRQIADMMEGKYVTRD